MANGRCVSVVLKLFDQVACVRTLRYAGFALDIESEYDKEALKEDAIIAEYGVRLLPELAA